MFVHKMWNDQELSKMVAGGVLFPMLSDAGGKVGTVYGVYDGDAGVVRVPSRASMFAQTARMSAAHPSCWYSISVFP